MKTSSVMLNKWDLSSVLKQIPGIHRNCFIRTEMGGVVLNLNIYSKFRSRGPRSHYIEGVIVSWRFFGWCRPCPSQHWHVTSTLHIMRTNRAHAVLFIWKSKIWLILEQMLTRNEIPLGESARGCARDTYLSLSTVLENLMSRTFDGHISRQWLKSRDLFT